MINKWREPMQATSGNSSNSDVTAAVSVTPDSACLTAAMAHLVAIGGTIGFSQEVQDHILNQECETCTEAITDALSKCSVIDKDLAYVLTEVPEDGAYGIAIKRYLTSREQQ